MKKRLPTRREFLEVIAGIPVAGAIASCGADAPGDLPDAGGAEPDMATANPCGPTLDLKLDCGATGDGLTNDTAAFQMAAQLIQAAGCGELRIPAGTYVVGRQQTKSDPAAAGSFYAKEEIFTVQNLSSLRVIGATGAVIRVASGLHYGGFDPMTGAPKDSIPPVQDEVAHVGRIFDITACDDVWISGLELDGNSQNLVLGGQWGDKDRQCQANGIRLSLCKMAEVQDVHTHHHGLDGIGLGQGTEIPLIKKPHRLVRVVSEYNGRQGLSCGGWGLEAIDCKFNHTGRVINQGGGADSGMVLRSAPAGGIDIEPNQGSFARDLVFTRCEFVDNAGAGMTADKGDGAYATFDDCTFWGTTGYSIWANRPGLVFSNSRIYGSATHLHDGHSDDAPGTPVPALATQFTGCTFEDKPWTDGNVNRSGYLYAVSGSAGGGTLFKDCTFIAHEVGGVLMGDATTKETFDGCTFIHGNSALATGSAQSSFHGSELRSCIFEETAAVSNGGKSYYIGLDAVVVSTPSAGASPTHVDGPEILWGKAGSGLVGDIPPGTY